MQTRRMLITSLLAVDNLSPRHHRVDKCILYTNIEGGKVNDTIIDPLAMIAVYTNSYVEATAELTAVAS